MLHLKPGRKDDKDKLLFTRVFSYKNGAFMCPSQSTPWANADFPKKYLKSVFRFSSSINSTKIWLSSLFSPKFYRWMYEYLKNCTTTAQIKNTVHLKNLSMYSLKCFNDILEEVNHDSFIKSTSSFRLIELHIFFSLCSWLSAISQRCNHAQTAC
jgi:hypothetical protein